MQASVAVVMSDFGQNAKEIRRAGIRTGRIGRIYLGWRMNWGVRGGAAVNSVGVTERGSGGIPSSSFTVIFLLLVSSNVGGPKPNAELGRGAPEKEPAGCCELLGVGDWVANGCSSVPLDRMALVGELFLANVLVGSSTDGCLVGHR